MKKYIIIIFSLFVTSSLFAQKEDSNHEWLSYSLEVKMPGASRDELFDRCRYISGNNLGVESFSRCDWDHENYIKRYDFDWDLFEYENNKYRVDYKVFIACKDEAYTISLGFIKARIHSRWGDDYIFKYDYMTSGKEGVRGGIAHSTYNRHDTNVRNMFAEFFQTVCTSIKADMRIPRN